MNKDTKLWLIILTAVVGLLFVGTTFIQRYQIKDLRNRVYALETDINQMHSWVSQIDVQEYKNTATLSNSYNGVEKRLNALEYNFQTMEDEVCGEPCFLDPTMQYVSRIDELENDLKIFSLSLNPDRMNLNLFLQEFCHQAMLDGEHDQWEVCQYLHN